jgi:hypothetical protein
MAGSRITFVVDRDDMDWSSACCCEHGDVKGRNEFDLPGVVKVCCNGDSLRAGKASWQATSAVFNSR